MRRAEAAIYASATPDSRETLAGFVGDERRLDALIGDINEALKVRPYEIVFVAGGFPFRTRPRHAETLRALAAAADAGPPSLTKLEMLPLSAVGYQQPITRVEPSRLAGHDISRDILGRLKSLGVIAAGPRARMPGAPIAWVTTQRFLEIFALGGLRDLSDLDMLEIPPRPRRELDHRVEAALDDALGLDDEESTDRDGDAFDEAALEEEPARFR